MRETKLDPNLKYKNSLNFDLTIPFSQSNQNKTKMLVSLKLKGQNQNRSQPSKL